MSQKWITHLFHLLHVSSNRELQDLQFGSRDSEIKAVLRLQSLSQTRNPALGQVQMAENAPNIHAFLRPGGASHENFHIGLCVQELKMENKSALCTENRK